MRPSILTPARPVLAILLCVSACLRADIYEWAYVNPSDPSQGKIQSGILTPGGAGVNAVPSAYLANLNLTKGYFIGGNLTGANFYYATLSNADLTNANITSAYFNYATLSNATLSGATITGANFGSTTNRGFTKEQLYSTASYQSGNLSDVVLGSNDLSGWYFAGQNLTSAYFWGSTLSNANLSNANLTSAYFIDATLSNANLSNATITGAYFGATTSSGFTKEQFYSTASYQSGNLTGVVLGYYNDLSG